MGRAWTTASGNLFASTIVRLGAADPSPATLSFVASIALFETLAPFLPDGTLKLKWPNDVMLDGAKVSGILLERLEDAVVIGFGVNVVGAPRVEGREIACLAHHAITPLPDVGTLTLDLAHAFSQGLAAWRAGGADPILRRWLGVAYSPGSSVTVSLPDGTAVKGAFAGVDSNGALILKREDGQLQVIHAGDVEMVRNHPVDGVKGH